jgi:glycosyltransferase involved in cell wall biosynthesis
MKLDKKILFCGYDFEQKLYRGTSFYAKAIIRATEQLGSYNYVLTSARTEKSDCLQELSIVRNLETPGKSGRKKIILKYIKDLLGLTRYKEVPRNYINNDESNLNSKLNYLNYIDGYINKSSIYELIGFQSRLFDFPYSIDVGNADILFCTSPMNVRNKNRRGLTIQTLHDILPLVAPYHPPTDNSRIFYKRVKNMLIYSDFIFSVSEFSKQEILKIFPRYENKICVTYQPISINKEEKILAQNDLLTKAVLAKYRLEESTYLIFVGVLEKRKNIDIVIDAYLAIKDKLNMPLVLVGSLGYGSERLRKIIKSASIRQIGYVSNMEKLVLLKNANLFLFPSLYEGFGLPPLEAMTMGCPVLVSNNSSLPEVCKDAAFYVNPNSLTEVAEGIMEMVNNSSLRTDLINKGYKVSSHFSFENYQKTIKHIMTKI